MFDWIFHKPRDYSDLEVKVDASSIRLHDAAKSLVQICSDITQSKKVETLKVLDLR